MAFVSQAPRVIASTYPSLRTGSKRSDLASSEAKSGKASDATAETVEASALDYAIKNQRYRRNLADDEILHCVEAVHRARDKGGDRKSEKAKSKASSEAFDKGKASDATAETVGISRAKVERALVVSKDAEARAAVLAGEKTINAAYTEVQAKKREGKPRKPKPEPPPEPPPEPVEPEPPPEPEPEPVAVAPEKPAALFGSPVGHDATAALAKIDALIARYLDELGDSDRILFIAGLMERVDSLRIEYEVTSTEVTIEL